MLQFARKWLLSPGLTDLLFELAGKGRYLRGGIALSKDAGFDACTLLELRTAPPSQTLWVNSDAIRFRPTAFDLSSHPYTLYFRSGNRVLADFFGKSTSNIFDAVGLDPNSFAWAPTTTQSRYRLPWEIDTAPPPRDTSQLEGRLQDFTHETLVPDVEVKRQVKRLLAVKDSIDRNGFLLLNSADRINYTLLIDDRQPRNLRYRAVLVRGQHRAAYLFHKGWTKIPMSPDPVLPREVRLSDLDNWSGVLDGEFNPTAASSYFLAFFQTSKTVP